METIKEEAVINANINPFSNIDWDKKAEIDRLKDKFIDGFIAGAEFVQRWIPVEEELPPTDTVLLCEVEDYYIIGRFDGEKWINDSDLSTEKVTHWRPIYFL